MSESPFEMSFDPRTIKHLGLQMYSTLPPALAEIISNAYDADAANVTIRLFEEDNTPVRIEVEDDGSGLSFDDINEKFLIIGRDRREQDGDKPSPKFNRKPIGKKGLGKLALFGLANRITVRTTKDGMKNEFILDWEKLTNTEGNYRPEVSINDEATEGANGTIIILSELKRKSSFKAEELADSLSRYFIFDKDFHLNILTTSNEVITVDNDRKLKQLTKEFEWDIESEELTAHDSPYFGKVIGVFMTSKKPLKPSSGLRGVTLFSRGKLVNAPEYFSSSASSYFFQYLTGWLSIDFIDDFDEDVISTNRQSINWDNADMAKLHAYLAEIVGKIRLDWRKKRDEAKIKILKAATSIDIDAWTETLPKGLKSSVEKIINALGGEDTYESYTPIIEVIYKDAIPPYPYFHWRHLHSEIKDASKKDYMEKDYYRAFIEAAKRYISATRRKSKSTEKSEHRLMGKSFGSDNALLSVTKPYTKPGRSSFSTDTIDNIEEGQKFYSMGVVAGGRNPLAHEEIDDLRKSGLFTEKDCLDALSLLSHLFRRLDDA